MLEGEILTHGAGVERRVGKGGTIFNPRGVEHAFVVLSEVAGPVDFRRVGEAAAATGATEILGPPPFAKR